MEKPRNGFDFIFIKSWKSQRANIPTINMKDGFIGCSENSNNVRKAINFAPRTDERI